MPNCPTPDKVGYSTRGHALKTSRRWSYTMNPYLCDCGSWHLASRRKVGRARHRFVDPPPSAGD